MTDNEATRTTIVRTRPALHEDEAEAEALCYEAEAENVGLRPCWPQGLNIPGGTMAQSHHRSGLATLPSVGAIPQSPHISVD